ncbi:hypothetical protein [Spirosoma flavum]|uniref:Uncharacterized protein n=1 Tax=Spirosoma flavum TaxID=2048557 RepID=A0ABW6AJK9_9BACT
MKFIPVFPAVSLLQRQQQFSLLLPHLRLERTVGKYSSALTATQEIAFYPVQGYYFSNEATMRSAKLETAVQA